MKEPKRTYAVRIANDPLVRYYIFWVSRAGRTLKIVEMTEN